MAIHVIAKSQDGPNCAGRPNDSSARPIGTIHGLLLVTAVFPLIAFSTVYKAQRRLYYAVLECVDIHKVYILRPRPLSFHLLGQPKTYLTEIGGHRDRLPNFACP